MRLPVRSVGVLVLVSLLGCGSEEPANAPASSGGAAGAGAAGTAGVSGGAGGAAAGGSAAGGGALAGAAGQTAAGAAGAAGQASAGAAGAAGQASAGAAGAAGQASAGAAGAAGQASAGAAGAAGGAACQQDKGLSCVDCRDAAMGAKGCCVAQADASSLICAEANVCLNACAGNDLACLDACKPKEEACVGAQEKYYLCENAACDVACAAPPVPVDCPADNGASYTGAKACDACQKAAQGPQGCCREFAEACSANASCLELAKCAEVCLSADCVQACASQAPEGLSTYAILSECLLSGVGGQPAACSAVCK